MNAVLSLTMAAVAASRAADARFEALSDDLETTNLPAYEAEEDRMLEAFRNACDQTPTTWIEFIAMFEIMTADGACGMDEDRVKTMLGHARRLAKGA